MSVNKVVLIGNVGAEPEIKHFGNGGQVANITLATSESYKNKDGEKITNTEWHRIAVTGKLSEIVEKYVKKGHLLYIEGQLKTRSWEDKDGNKKYVTEVSVRDFGGSIKMLSKKSDDISDVESQNTSPNVSTNIEPESNDDLPF